MQQLSPKKYIETKARSLPIYKCLVNKDWEEAKMADVIVMRRHSNGHITAGIYLVDLLCLGVKDTFYYFNEPEEEVEDRFGSAFSHIFKEIDYSLAHNIIYAGLDFAMEYEIKPHHDFAITRFILEEDTENIPLIDIAVGSEDGKPHLVVNEQNQFQDALAKLKQIAGEGNYYYTIGSKFDEFEDENEELDDMDEEEEEEISLDEIPIGTINTINVQNVRIEDLMDVEKIKERQLFEQIIINAETMTRVLPDEIKELNDKEEQRWDSIWEEILDQAEFPNGMNQELMDEFYNATDELVNIGDELKDEGLYSDSFSNRLIEVLEAHVANPMVVVDIFENSNAMSLEEVAEKAKGYMNELQQQYPYIQISLALDALLNETRDLRFSNIYNAKSIKEAFPKVKQFYQLEVLHFWMIKMCLSLESRNLKDAVQYYYIIRETQINEWLFELVLIKYNNFLLEHIKSSMLER